LSRDSLLAIAAETKRLGIPFAGHVPRAVTAAEASDAGQKSIEHLTGVLESCSTAENEFRNGWAEVQAERAKNGDSPELQAKFTPLWRKMLAGYDSSRCSALARHLARNKTWQTPTLAEGLPFVMNPAAMTDDARLRYVPPKTAEDWRRSLASMIKEPPTRRQKEYEVRLAIVRDLHRAGVPILAGTDAGSSLFISNVAGFSLHDELSLLVRAGLTPMEALQSATVNPARYLGLSASLGTVQKGKIADLVLLDADPLADITNTTKINAVVLNGRLLDRAALDKMFTDVAEEESKR
jgi:imidazolonepropionase-like amidohydrolase